MKIPKSFSQNFEIMRIDFSGLWPPAELERYNRGREFDACKHREILRFLFSGACHFAAHPTAQNAF